MAPDFDWGFSIDVMLLKPRSRGTVRLCDDQPPHAALGAKVLHRLVRDNAYSVPQVVRTCAVGPSPGNGAVVDATGAVHGVEHHMVIDASVMPDIPSGFPHIPTVMISERLTALL